MPSQILSLFVIILIVGQPTKPMELWQKHRDNMAEDILHREHLINQSQQLNDEIYNEVLIKLQEELEQMHSSVDTFEGIPNQSVAQC
jgi:hypothetical protein